MPTKPILARIRALTILLGFSPESLITNRGRAVWQFKTHPMQNQGKNFDAEDQEVFIRKFIQSFQSYSREEARNVYRDVRQYVALPENGCGIFSLILNVATTFLHMDGDDVVVRHKHMVQWREAVHVLGQSIFLSAFLAKENDLLAKSDQRCDFSPYAKSDNLRLRNILAQGVAENHFHLKGSAPAFLIAWVCLMNNILNRKVDFHDPRFRILLCGAFSDYDKGRNNEKLHEEVIQAAAIRLFFFRLLKGEDNRKYLQKNPLRYLKLPRIFTLHLQRDINAIRAILYPNSLDYIIDTSNIESPYGILAGEHTFLYSIFKHIFQKNQRFLKYADLFYAYLRVFVRLRQELVQVNDTVGFDNFYSYQDRKEVFLERYPRYKNALIEMAFASALRHPALRSLEARVVPKRTPKLLYHEHIRLDRLAAKADSRLCHMKANSTLSPGESPIPHLTHCQHFDLKKGLCRRANGPCDQALSKLFYVLHFVKRPEKQVDWSNPAEKAKAIGHYRHFGLRNEISQTAQAIIKWRHSGVRQAGKVYGIDACNHEISCRPEVFSSDFRRLRAHSNSPIYKKLHGRNVPSLRITFHVGEDFLDVVDGLRAIDEAKRFMELRHGDRLGHALALGIDAAKWYNLKGHRVILTRQELLDNVAWFYCRLRKHGLCSQELAHHLRVLYEELFALVYAGFSGTNLRVPIETYYDAWKLRGDHPKHYLNPEKPIPTILPKQFMHELQQEDRQLQTLRTPDSSIVHLMHHYHYNPDVKRTGEKIIEFEITSHYSEAVIALQKILQREISFSGIGIETNPSSNYMIGTFKNYKDHPIIRFYDNGLQESPNAEQLFVSINTDDQGIFDTDLENEYVLMACALETKMDSHGKPLYKPSSVYQWIDNVRRMGLEQSFQYLSDHLKG